MLREPAGLRQLHRALVDYANGHAIRVVDENGTIVRTDDGAQEQPVTDAYLRATFPKGTHRMTPIQYAAVLLYCQEQIDLCGKGGGEAAGVRWTTSADPTGNEFDLVAG
jgi:hypothetical protein